METITEVAVPAGTARQAVALWLAQELDLSPGATRRLFDSGAVRRGRVTLWPFAGVEAGHVVTVCDLERNSQLRRPVDIPLAVQHETSEYVVVLKPRGLAVHPGPGGDATGTLHQALLFRYPHLAEQADERPWPGLVHRLDRDTSGLMVCPLSRQAQAALEVQFSSRQVVKNYLALVGGTVDPPQGTIEASMRVVPSRALKMRVSDRGQEAITDYSLVEAFPRTSLVALRLHTGRTHQIRVHMAHIGHPLVGDQRYGGTVLEGLRGQVLHAGRLGFRDPGDGVFREFAAPLPAELEALVALARADGIVVERSRRREKAKGAEAPRSAAPVVAEVLPPEVVEHRRKVRMRMDTVKREIFHEDRNHARDRFYADHRGETLTLGMRGGGVVRGVVVDVEPRVLQVGCEAHQTSVNKIDVTWVRAEAGDVVEHQRSLFEGEDLRPSISRLVTATARGAVVQLLTVDAEVLSGRVAWLDRYCVGLEEPASRNVTLVYRHALLGLHIGAEDNIG